MQGEKERERRKKSKARDVCWFHATTIDSLRNMYGISQQRMIPVQ